MSIQSDQWKLKRNISEQTMPHVDVCPENSTTITKASNRLGCGKDSYGNKQYLCLPNVDKTSLVEFCYDGIIGYHEKGYCLQASKRNLTLYSCERFSSGCPETIFKSSDFYKYSACQKLNREHRCYILDPNCPPNANEKTNGNLVTYSILGVFIAFAIIGVLCFLLCYLRKRKTQSKAEDNNEDHSEEHSLRMNEHLDPLLRTNGAEQSELDGNSAEQKFVKTKEKKHRSMKKVTDDTFKEIEGLFEGKEALDTVKSAVLGIKECMDTDAEMYDVFNNLKDVLRLGTMLANNLETTVLELKATCLFLTTVFQKNQFSLQKIIKLPDQRETYPALPENDDLWCEAVVLEENMLRANAILTGIDDDATKTVLDTLQDKIYEKDMVKLLTKLKSQAKALMLKTEVISARRATAYVNLYFKFAILQSLVLWQVFCIKNGYGNDHSSTKGVYSLIKSSQTSNIEMLTCITHPKVKHAVFLSVCHLTENENILHFLRIQGIETLCFGESFYARKHYIQWSNSPNVKLQMEGYKRGIWGTYETNTGCEFNFELVEGREEDNICYIKSALWSSSYIELSNNGSCTAADYTPEPPGRKWKLIALQTDQELSTFIITSVDWPGRFLYLESPTWHKMDWYVRGKRNLAKVKEKGLWEICDV